MRTMINLLPASYRRQQIVRKRAMQWITIIAVVLVTGWGGIGIEMREQTAFVAAARSAGARACADADHAQATRRHAAATGGTASNKKRWPRNWNTSAMR